MASKQDSNIQKYFLIGSLIALLVILYFFMAPLLTSVLFSGVIVAAVYPLHRMLMKKAHLPKDLSAFITLILILLLIVTPFIIFFFFLAGEAVEAYAAIAEKAATFSSSDIQLLPDIIRNSFLGGLFDWFQLIFPITIDDVYKSFSAIVGEISAAIFSQAASILKGFAVFLVQLLIFVITTFYFLRDGDKVIKKINHLMPLSKKYRDELFWKLKKLSYGIIYGIFGAAIAQGLLVGLGFYLVGISNPAFWGTMAALFSPLPYIGVSVVWVPAVIILFVTQQWIAAVFLLIWCLAIVSFADNLVKPLIIGKAAKIHPLLVFLVLIGGIIAFGLKGLFWGPLLLVLALTFLHIYELEYKHILKK